MGETKPYRSEKSCLISISDTCKPQSEWNRRNNVSLLTFIKYLCGPRYSFVQILKIASLMLLAATCLLNLKLVTKTSSKLENHQILLDFDERENVAPFNEEDYFGHYRANDDAASKESFEIKVRSSRDKVEVYVNDEQVHYNDVTGYCRGVHITVIHESTGAVMSKWMYDIQSSMTRNKEEFIKFLTSISSGRILVFAVKEDAKFHLDDAGMEELQRFGSKLIDQLDYRSMWAMVSSGKGQNFAEKHEIAADGDSWGKTVEITALVDAVKNPNDVCNWPDSPGSRRRALFCSKFDGYRELCQCKNPSPVVFETGEPFPASSVPVAVIASNRPQYLYRMLSTLLAVRGANPDKIIIFIDGQFEEPFQIGRLFGLKTYQHVPVSVENARISQHYKSSLRGIFTLFPDADKAIILEEDLDVSPDFFSYFSQTMHLLDVDSSLYCISAWNDQGFNHSCHDPTLLYRVETMTRLGWMLKRSLFENELVPKWPTPEEFWYWNDWMRSSSIRQGRECIIPDISRTYHFGSSSIMSNKYIFEKYFGEHAIYKKLEVAFKDVDKMTRSSYEEEMHSLIQNSVLLDHYKSPCWEDFVPIAAENVSYVAYFRMPDKFSTDVFLEISKCLQIWNLDAKGLHKSSFRTFIRKQHVVFIGYPASPYSRYKPVDTIPISLKSLQTWN